jgi:ribosomal protein S18 acetylase RimI-like enzyme
MDPHAPPDLGPSAAHVWRAEPHEAEAVAALLVAFRDHLGFDWPSDNAFLASVERLIEDPATEYLLGAAQAGAPAAGLVQLRFRWSVWRAAEDCELEDLFVSAQARRAGLGRALLAAAIDRARARGARRIALDTAERNEAAVALYRSFGFGDEAYEGGRAMLLRLALD